MKTCPPDLPHALLTRLAEIGNVSDFEALPSCIGSYPELMDGQMMRQRPDYWYAVAERLSDQELEGLIKALTIAEKTLPNFRSGSVAPVIFLFRRFADRKTVAIDPLADWVLSHTDNNYLPWGCSNRGAMSTTEYRDICRHIAERKVAVQTTEKARQNEAATRKALKATQDLANAIRRKDVQAILALRRKGADVQAKNVEGKNALELAEDSDSANVLRALTDPLTAEEMCHPPRNAKNE
jgi:hypothetical protein